MPQFNWAVLGPIVLLLALLLGGAVLLASHVPHPALQAVHSAAAPAEPSNLRSATTPAGPQLVGRVIGTPHIRSEPNSNAAVVQDLQSGQAVQVTACSASCAWYLVSVPGQAAPGWVSSAFVDLQGDDRKLPAAR